MVDAEILVGDKGLGKAGDRRDHPVQTHSGGHDPSPVNADEGQHIHHGLHAAGLRLAGGHLLSVGHVELEPKAGDQGQGRDHPQEGEKIRALRGGQKIQPQELEPAGEGPDLVQVLRSEHGQMIPQRVEVADHFHFGVDAAGGHGGHHAGDAADEIGGLLDPVRRDVQGVGQGHNHRVVNAKHDGEGNQGGQAPGAGIDAFLLVELCQLLVILLLVVAVDFLQLFLLFRHLRLRSHAPLLLDGEGEQHHLDDDGKENDGHAVVVEDVIQEPQQIAQDASEEIENCHHNERYAPLLARTGLLLLALFLRDRVVTAPAPGVAAQNAPKGQRSPFECPKPLDGLQTVLGAGGDKPAPGRKQGRHRRLVKADDLQKRPLHACGSSRPSASSARPYCLSSLL